MLGHITFDGCMWSASQVHSLAKWRSVHNSTVAVLARMRTDAFANCSWRLVMSCAPPTFLTPYIVRDCPEPRVKTRAHGLAISAVPRAVQPPAICAPGHGSEPRTTWQPPDAQQVPALLPSPLRLAPLQRCTISILASPWRPAEHELLPQLAHDAARSCSAP